jgi:hypothetical protein
MKRNNIPACTREYIDPSEMGAKHDKQNTAERRTLTSFKPSRMWFNTSSVTRWHPFARLESVNVVCQPIILFFFFGEGESTPGVSWVWRFQERIAYRTEIKESAKNDLIVIQVDLPRQPPARCPSTRL